MQKIKRKKRSKFFLGCLLFLFLIFLVAGCKDEQPKKTKVNLHRKILKKKIGNQKKVINIAEQKKKSINFQYALHSDRDPFLPFFKLNTEKDTLEEEANIPRTPLTMYSLSQLKLRAIMFSKNKPPIAMVETEDKMGLFFSVGEYIGTELFKVVKITNEFVLVEKRKKDFLNNYKIIQKVLSIENEGE